MKETVIACDTGGTFTDFVMYSPSRGLATLKLSSTPHDPSCAVIEGVSSLSPERPPERVHHATTVATNALLEGTGGRVLFITTEGFGDMLLLGRGERQSLYALEPTRVPPLAKREDTIEAKERTAADGSVTLPLELSQLVLPEGDYDAVAVCLLHSGLNPAHEQQIESSLASHTVFSSHRLAPGSGEYERATTTVLAAYLSSKISRYLGNLKEALNRSELRIVHSAGGLLTTEEARAFPHRLALSGPAAGLRGALTVGQECRRTNLVTLDMGGTSTDVALILEGELPYTWQTRVEGYPLRAPSLEIHTIGAGGGSIAWKDESGLLRVGPRSAGAVPGPACYDRGGDTPTVSDALCLTGYLPSTLGTEELTLSEAAAEKALGSLAEALGLDLLETADGVLEIAAAHLAEAVRQVTTGQGQDPADFTLFPFGGAGPLMACMVAESLAMREVLVPARAGVLSAWGALTAPWEREWSAPIPADFRSDEKRILRELSKLRDQAAKELSEFETFKQMELVARRYKGQGETLYSAPEVDFHTLHQKRFGFQRSGHSVETVEVRLRVQGAPLSAPLSQTESEHTTGTTTMLRWRGDKLEVPVYQGVRVGLEGPALILQDGSTLFIAPGWRVDSITNGHLLLNQGESA